MTPRKIRFLPLMLMILSCLFVMDGHAQRRCHLRGTVLDDNGAPVELVTVRIEGQAAGSMTNLNGKYSFSYSAKDTVVVVFSLVGYETRKRTLVNPPDSMKLDVRMPPLGISLGGATVQGQRIQTGTMQKLTPEGSKQMPSTTGNAVEELIATQAGVSTHSELSSQYNVRGGSFDENCVYLNGVEVYRPMLVRSGQQEGLSIINSDMVESIGFSSGGFAARYGDRMSSVLDITYKKPEQFEANVAASFLGASAYVGWGNEHFSVMNSVRYKTTRYLLGSLETSGEYRPNFLDYQTVWSWRPSQRWEFGFIGNVSDNHYNFEPEDRETNFGTMNDAKSFRVYFDGKEKDQFRTYFGALSLTRHFNKSTNLTLNASAFASKEEETYDIQGEYWLNEATSQEQLGVGTYLEHARNRLQARMLDLGVKFKTKLTAHTLEAGFDWKLERIRENSREWEMRDSMGYSLPHSPDRLMLIYSLRSHDEMRSNRFEAYVQDTWRMKSSIGLFTLNYGLRLSHWDWNGETLFSPRASLGYLPSFNEDLTFRFATGIYYQAPFYKELKDTTTVNGVTTVQLNKNIKSQRSIHFVLGGDYTFRMLGRPFRFTTEVYYKAMSNLIPYNVDNVRIVYYGQNLSRGYATGIDFKLFGEFVPGADSWITFSLMTTKEKLGGRWIPRPTDQRYNFSLYFTDFFPGTTRWRMTLKAAFADGLPFGPPHSGREKQTFRAPAYKRVDIGMSYRLLNNEDRHITRGIGRMFRNIWLGVDAFNVLGIDNVNSYYWVIDITNTQYAVPNYLTGRQISVRFSIDF